MLFEELAHCHGPAGTVTELLDESADGIGILRQHEQLHERYRGRDLSGIATRHYLVHRLHRSRVRRLKTARTERLGYHGNLGSDFEAAGQFAVAMLRAVWRERRSSRVRSSSNALEAVEKAPAKYGQGDNGFIPIAIRLARERGAAVYVGDGAN